jgi:hypothetical protein
METETSKTKRRRPAKKIILWTLAIIFALLTIAVVYVSQNFNRILSGALTNSFNSSSVSDVYELKFEKLRVNIFTGNINVLNVVMQPRSKPLHDYPYINSSFRLETRKIELKDVHLMELIKSGKLELKRIEINKPDIQLRLNGEKYVLLPYKDTTLVSDTKIKSNKKFLTSFVLNEFALIDASFHVVNSTKQREFSIQNLTISLNELKLDQQPGMDLFSFQKVGLKVGNVSGSMLKGAFRNFDVKNFSLSVEALDIRKSPDTLVFHYGGFSTGLNNLSINTADSIFNIAINSLAISYAKNSVDLGIITFKSNVSQAALLKRDKYQKAYFSLAVGSLKLENVNFDSLIYNRKIFVDEIKIDKIGISLYKDKNKPVDKNKFPQYIGQKIAALPIPVLVKSVKATGVNLVNLERKTDGKMARVTVQRGTLEAKNITNQSPDGLLTLNATAFIENKAPVNLTVAYSYRKPQFSINCKVGKFNLSDLNQLLTAYTPAKVRNGTVDEITLSGVANRRGSTGTMKFLYHNLDIDMQLKDQAKWKNDVIAFAANTYLASSNPPAGGAPARTVRFEASRDLNKGGFNIILRSLLSGLKETMIMSKENKKAYKVEKKKWKSGKNK